MFVWMCAGLIQWQSLASISTQMIDQGMLMLSPESLLLSASEPPRQVSSRTPRIPISDNEKHWDSNAYKTISLHTPSFHPQSVYPAIKEFVLIPQHTTPTNTTKELDALYDVLQHVRLMWKTEVKAHFCWMSVSVSQKFNH